MEAITCVAIEFVVTLFASLPEFVSVVDRWLPDDAEVNVTDHGAFSEVTAKKHELLYAIETVRIAINVEGASKYALNRPGGGGASVVRLACSSNHATEPRRAPIMRVRTRVHLCDTQMMKCKEHFPRRR